MRILCVALLMAGCATANDVRGPSFDTGPEGGAELDLPEPTTEEDTGVPVPEDTGAPTDTGEPEDTGGASPAATDEACYLGPQRDSTVCLPVGILEPLPVAYQYPAPLNGSAQYLPPLTYLDLYAHDENEALAPNFILGEFAQAWKGRYAVVQPHAVARVQAIRDELGPIVVNSGYRNPEYNASVGGATWSRHQYGDAFDLDPVSVDLATLDAACRAHGAGYVGVYETHIHCDWRNDALSEPFFGLGRQWITPSSAPALDASIVHRGTVLTAPASGWDEGEPLREWRAFDASDAMIASSVTRTFNPPPRATRVEVTVGRVLTRSLRLE
jgi:hypothetical protein